MIGTDYYPTLLEAAGQAPRPHQHVDGVSLVPLLKGSQKLNREALYWHYPHYNQHPQSFPSGVVRGGKWKLIDAFETGRTELYDLEADIGEQHDLSGREPDREAELRSMLRRWQAEVGADPMSENPQYRR